MECQNSFYEIFSSIGTPTPLVEIKGSVIHNIVNSFFCLFLYDLFCFIAFITFSSYFGIEFKIKDTIFLL